MDSEPATIKTGRLNDRTRKGLEILQAALISGLAGNLLLRAMPWGLNAFLWGAIVSIALWVVATRHREGAKGATLALHGALVFFAGMFIWRDAPELLFADVVSFLVILSVLTLPVMSLRMQQSGLAHYALGWVYTGLNAALSPIILVMGDIKWDTMSQGRNVKHFTAVFRGLLVALPLIMIFGALFVAADATYQNLIEKTFQIDLPTVFNHVLLTGFLSWIAAGYLRGSAFLTIDPAKLPDDEMETKVAKADLDLKEENAPPPKKEPFNLQDMDNALLPPAFTLGAVEIGIVLGLMNLLFLSFVAVQVPYLFGGMELVQATENFKLADYARRGFFELVWVAALVLPILLAAHWLIRKNDKLALRLYQGLAVLQIALLSVIMLSAGQRMLLYTGMSGYGLTTMRFYPMVFMLWLAIIFVWFAATVLRGQRQRFAWGALWSALAFIAVLHFFNPDRFIAQTNLNLLNSGRGFDAHYLRELSADALPVTLSLSQMPSLTFDERCVVQHDLTRYAEKLSRETDLRSWNWARWNGRRQLAETVSSFDLTGCDPVKMRKISEHERDDF